MSRALRAVLARPTRSAGTPGAAPAASTWKFGMSIGRRAAIRCSSCPPSGTLRWFRRPPLQALREQARTSLELHPNLLLLQPFTRMKRRTTSVNVMASGALTASLRRSETWRRGAAQNKRMGVNTTTPITSPTYQVTQLYGRLGSVIAPAKASVATPPLRPWCRRWGRPERRPPPVRPPKVPTRGGRRSDAPIVAPRELEAWSRTRC
jgi:hypothetical protein